MIEQLQRLQRGIHRMTRQQFRNALRRSLRADKSYADGCWIPFQDNPLGYLCTRRPQVQAEELIRVALRLGKEG